MSTALCWFRNDLRLHDNETLHRALANHDRVLCLHAINRALFRQLTGPDIPKTGPHRAKFLLDSLADLKANLREAGGDLHVEVTDDVAGTVSALVAATGATAVYVQAEIMSEETAEEAAVEAALPEGCQLVRVWGKSLYHRDDLDYPADECPEPFKKFRKSVEPLSVRKPLPVPDRVPAPKDFDFAPLPTLSGLGLNPEDANPAYPGGESAGLARLDYYLEETNLIQKYRSTRNRSLGPDYSTKFSPYFALGCLSPRYVYQRVTDYGRATKSRGGNSVLFEMRWRDFFLYLGLKHGNRLFQPGGFKERQTEWSHDRELFTNWCRGETGLPFIDAHMRELAATGFMSNRGRVNCASFLTRDYKIDWRWGAAWFENQLIDYEVCANWFNWHTQALEIYYTSAPWQGLKYDKKGEYVKAWLPELAELPPPSSTPPGRWRPRVCWKIWSLTWSGIISVHGSKTASGTGPGGG